MYIEWNLGKYSFGKIQKTSHPQTLEYQINWEIYTSYEGAAGMVLHINGNITMGKFNLSHFAFKRSLMSVSWCRSIHEASQVVRFPAEVKLTNTIKLKWNIHQDINNFMLNFFYLSIDRIIVLLSTVTYQHIVFLVPD